MTRPAFELFSRLSLATALVLPSACASGPADPTAPPWEGRDFFSRGVTAGDGPHTLVDGTRLELRFRSSSRLVASAGCNSMSGTYRVDDGALVLEKVVTTEIGCDAARQEQDLWYFGIVRSRPSLTLEGSMLVLEAEGARIEYLDRDAAARQ